MSDEYGRNGFKNSLVDESINPEGTTIDERLKNYPPENDSGFSTTQEIGSDKAQRGNIFEVKRDDTPANGLIDQSPNGSNLKNEIQDAKQGKYQ
ncbi:hypothetical protein J3R30DRAFT_674602 [Lentinula aciculospora]|uniref:Uncharacterized protein n=1 Tax=Lentinula aciculospora TaxID=153920 RepID=A0A9W9A629_9AGAR|nr:hypothetical protein J3R30DRAFT_674602 [Lentinula aciculospora]